MNSGSGADPLSEPVARAVVFDPWYLDEESWRVERERLAAWRVALIVPVTNEEADLALPSADVVVVMGARHLDAPRIRGLGRAVGILCRSIGMDSVDVEEARRAGIPVRNIPGYCTDEVSDHALALLLSAERRIVPLAVATSSGRWDFDDPSPIDTVRRLRGQTLGIVGAGRIGRLVAQKARAFGFETIAFDPGLTVAPDDELALVTLEELLKRADALVLCAPLTPSSRRMINEEALSTVRRGLILVNVGRGGLVDEQALAEALRDGRVGVAALDVRDPEPPEAAADPLAGLSNVIVTPHVASYSIDSDNDLRLQAADIVLQLLEAGDRLFVV